MRLAFLVLLAINARADSLPAVVDLAALREEARRTGSSALVVLKDGKIIAQDYFGGVERPIETMSATKSIVNLAVGFLVDAGKLKLDDPIWRFYPEWKQGKKKSITVRQLLNHTSGLQAQRTTGEEIYPAPDFVKLALAAELSDDPGTKFFYNNKAVNLLAGVVEVASGVPLDKFTDDHLFRPLGISDWRWAKDGAGHPHAMAGLRLRATDLAKIGQLLLDDGVWQGKRLLSHQWIEESTRPGQTFVVRCGLLWWLMFDSTHIVIDDEEIATWRKAGLEEDFIRKLLPLKDRKLKRTEFFTEINKILGDPEIWYAHTWKRGLPDGKEVQDGAPAGFYADGYLGQYLVVLPGQRIVAVRQLAAREDMPDAKNYNSFEKFPEMVRKLK
jgi:CubicO group peptidase (beta-lactamase class C family)